LRHDRQDADATTITTEFPSGEGEPYYPVPCSEARALYKRYEALALSEKNVTFIGRLATYQYLNMDQVVGQAMAAFRKLNPAQN
jgi:UDP-galactopyranose mutase